MKLLIAGDFAAHTGFARVNEAIANELAAHGWDISVMAINYMGDATPLQQHYALYPAHGGGDQWGVERIASLCQHVQPDALLLVHDPWIVSAWLRTLGDEAPPAVAYVPVDGQGVPSHHVRPLSACQVVAAYTRFGASELVRAGCEAPIIIIPHGIDLQTFYPIDQAEARAQLGIDADTYAVLVFDQNQPRKRLDIAFEAFARFAIDKPATVKLLYHGPMRTQNGWDVEAMADDLGISDRLMLSSRHLTARRGVKETHLRVIYSACDVRLSTTAGEGWSLPTMEAMACGLPNIAPDFGALGEWARDAALLVPAPHAVRHCGTFDGVGINTVGRVPEVDQVADMLGIFYEVPEQRAFYRERGLALVSDPRYAWSNIGAAFDGLLRQAVEQRAAEPMLVDELVSV